MNNQYKTDSDNNRYTIRFNQDGTIFDIIKHNNDNSMQWFNGINAQKVYEDLKKVYILSWNKIKNRFYPEYNNRKDYKNDSS